MLVLGKYRTVCNVTCLVLVKRCLHSSTNFVYQSERAIRHWRHRHCLWFQRCLSVANKREYSAEGRVNVKKPAIDMTNFPAENIRNFGIIAHVDHGKSTLSDRLMEITGTISKDQKNEQVLDKLPVERERGITVKAQTVSMFYDHKGKTYLLNMIDTPGHVDFSYEVARSLAACQGVILLVDANQGVQAQTVAHFNLAFCSDLTIIPVLNKIDLKNANPENVTSQLEKLFSMDSSEIIKVSAKFGTGVDELLVSVIERLKPPTGDVNKVFRACLFDFWFDRFRGVIALIAVKDGRLTVGDHVSSVATKLSYEVREIGILHPEETPVGMLDRWGTSFLT